MANTVDSRGKVAHILIGLIVGSVVFGTIIVAQTSDPLVEAVSKLPFFALISFLAPIIAFTASWKAAFVVVMGTILFVSSAVLEWRFLNGLTLSVAAAISTISWFAFCVYLMSRYVVI